MPELPRSVEPPIKAVEEKRVTDVRRLGKRVVLVLEEDLYIVMHLMIAGRFRWKPAGYKIPGRLGLAAFDFESGSLMWRSDPANRVHGSRDQLLRNLPNWGQASRGSRAFEVAQGRLAAVARRAGIPAPHIAALYGPRTALEMCLYPF